MNKALAAPPTSQKTQVECLARAIYFEARGESHEGKMAVANVILNRTNHQDFSHTICGTVYQRGQFSWTDKNYTVKDLELYNEIRDIAKQAILEYNRGDKLPAGDALYFTSAGFRGKDFKYVCSIGGHKFYTSRKHPKIDRFGNTDENINNGDTNGSEN